MVANMAGSLTKAVGSAGGTFDVALVRAIAMKISRVTAGW